MLSPETRRLLGAEGGANAGNAVASAFLNLYVFISTGQLMGLVWFNGGYFLTLTFVFYGCAWWLKRQPPVFPFRWGLALTAAFYAFLILVLPDSGHFVFLLGMLFGIGQGMYWLGNNIMTFDTVSPAARLRFYGYASALNSVSGVLGPTAGAALIAGLPHLTGYLAVFALALGLYFVAFWSSLWVPAGAPVRLPNKGDAAARLHHQWRLAFETIVVRGAREGVTVFAGVFFIYRSLHEPWMVGAYTAAAALIRTGSSLAVGRWLPVVHRPRSMWIGALGMTAAAALLIVHQSAPWVFGFGALTALTAPFFTIPNAALPMEVMDRDPRIAENRVSYVLSREVALNVGRLTSLAILFVLLRWMGTVWPLVGLLVFTAFAQSWIALVAPRVFSRPQETEAVLA